MQKLNINRKNVNLTCKFGANRERAIRCKMFTYELRNMQIF